MSLVLVVRDSSRNFQPIRYQLSGIRSEKTGVFLAFFDYLPVRKQRATLVRNCAPSNSGPSDLFLEKGVSKSPKAVTGAAVGAGGVAHTHLRGFEAATEH